MFGSKIMIVCTEFSEVSSSRRRSRASCRVAVVGSDRFGYFEQTSSRFELSLREISKQHEQFQVNWQLHARRRFHFTWVRGAFPLFRLIHATHTHALSLILFDLIPNSIRAIRHVRFPFRFTRNAKHNIPLSS